MTSDGHFETGQPTDGRDAEAKASAGADGRADADHPADDRSRAHGEAREASSAAQELADGLDLMLRAMRKAVKEVEAGRIEELGHKARQRLQRFDRRKMEELRRRAATQQDPRRIEDIAEEAGRELLRVVERVTDRFDRAVRGRTSGRGAPAPTTEDGKDGNGQDPAESDGDAEGAGPRVRVE